MAYCESPDCRNPECKWWLPYGLDLRIEYPKKNSNYPTNKIDPQKETKSKLEEKVDKEMGLNLEQLDEYEDIGYNKKINWTRDTKMGKDKKASSDIGVVYSYYTPHLQLEFFTTDMEFQIVPVRYDS